MFYLSVGMCRCVKVPIETRGIGFPQELEL